jgi:membrane fusion protein (multidrug efflux system)
MKKPMIIMLAAFVLLVVALGTYKFVQISNAIAAGSNWKPAPDAISTYIAKEETWNETFSAVGSIASVQGAMISSQQEGKIFKIGVESGALVNTGDLLIQIDTAVEEAQLKSAVAREELARINFTRAERLLKTTSISQAEFDSIAAELKRALADGNVIRAILDQKTIRAPFAGRVGIRVVNIGQYVPAGAPLIPLHTIDPVYVNFSVPQRHIATLKVGQDLSISSDAFLDQKFSGKLSAINPGLETETRNLNVQAVFDNKDEKLRPGMFVNVELTLAKRDKVIIIPSTAISYAPFGDSVFIVEDLKDPKGDTYKGVSQHFIKVGQARGDLVSVLSGLEPGKEVASSAVFKLRNGSAVQVDNSNRPATLSNPKVSES